MSLFALFSYQLLCEKCSLLERPCITRAFGFAAQASGSHTAVEAELLFFFFFFEVCRGIRLLVRSGSVFDSASGKVGGSVCDHAGLTTSRCLDENCGKAYCGGESVVLEVSFFSPSQLHLVSGHQPRNRTSETSIPRAQCPVQTPNVHGGFAAGRSVSRGCTWTRSLQFWVAHAGLGGDVLDFSFLRESYFHLL